MQARNPFLEQKVPFGEKTNLLASPQKIVANDTTILNETCQDEAFKNQQVLK